MKEENINGVCDLKAGYGQHASPQITQSDAVSNKSSVVNNISSLNPASSALKYWHDELSNANEESTRDMYEEKFAEFLQFIEKNPDELIVQRQKDLLNTDIKIQRRIEQRNKPTRRLEAGFQYLQQSKAFNSSRNENNRVRQVFIVDLSRRPKQKSVGFWECCLEPRCCRFYGLPV